MKEDHSNNILKLPSDQKNQCLYINGNKGLIVAINLDTGEHVFGENYKIEEAAQEFWKIVSSLI